MGSRRAGPLRGPVLIARDFLPKEPTRRSALAAAPLLVLALAYLAALARPGTEGEDWTLGAMTVEYVVLAALLVLSMVRDGEGKA